MLALFSTKDREGVDLLVDDKGIDDLIEVLSSLRGRRDHVHIFSSEWGGDTDRCQLSLPDVLEEGNSDVPVHLLTVHANYDLETEEPGE